MPDLSNALIPVAGCGAVSVVESRREQAEIVAFIPASAFKSDYVTREFARLTRAAIANGRRAAMVRARERAFVDYEFHRLTQAAIANGRRNMWVLPGPSARRLAA